MANKTQSEFSKKFQKITLNSHTQLMELMNDENMPPEDFVPIIATSIIGLTTTAANLLELEQEGSSTYLLKEVEAGAKQGGIANIKAIQEQKGSVKYSISDIKESDFAGGMNYVGEALATTLAEKIHELPTGMRNVEMYLRGIEVLLANLLSQRFGENSHAILDSLCEHVHMSLKDLGTRVVPIS
jgi:hypothetical protein